MRLTSYSPGVIRPTLKNVEKFRREDEINDRKAPINHALWDPFHLKYLNYSPVTTIMDSSTEPRFL